MFTIKINMENSAFEDNPQAEVIRILQDIIVKLESGRDYGNIFDVNGNKVGAWYS